MRVPAACAIAVGALTLASAAAPQSAEDGAHRPRGDGAFSGGVELVALTVTVERDDASDVSGLSRGDFHVFEEGVEQDTTFFEAGNNPIDLMVLIDASASMTGRLPLAKQAALRLIRSLDAKDRVAIMTIGHRLETYSPFTHDRQAIENAIEGIRPGQNTALYTTMYVALKSFGRLDGRTEIRRRAIVVLTDGADTTSLVAFDDVLALARESGVLVYPISLSLVAGHDTIDAEIAAAYELRALAHETGAKAYFPRELTDLDGTYQAIATEIAQQYSLGYVPVHHDQTHGLRHVQIVVDVPGVSVRSRTGYVAKP
jgi:Ca-activated chloride channel homolog